jgi:glycosyltransferase involved in cell wall biosynthesis
MHESHLPQVTVVGHPFAPIGRGEDARSMARALRNLRVPFDVVDVYGGPVTDPGYRAEFGGHLVERGGGDVSVFVLNGDEIQPALERLGGRLPDGGLRVAWPAWELSQYPAEWARLLERFDEVWVYSRFVRDAIAPAVRRPVRVMPPGNEVFFPHLLGRRHFGIPESAFALLFAFDFRSYVERKNPLAVLEAFLRLARRRPADDLCLVVKAAGRDARTAAHAEFLESLRQARSECGDRSVRLIEGELPDAAVKNLVRSCDCFVSLHRSEGFGRLLAEAMLMGKPVISTAYSGNLDFTTDANSCLVSHRLVPVPEGAYPFWRGQVWAEPDVDHAVWWMERLVGDWRLRARIGQAARTEIQTRLSTRAAGVRYLARLREV